MSILIYKQRHRHPNQKKTPKCNYAHIGYIATRPGAVKNEGMRHGLFGKLEPGEVQEFATWQEAARLVRELSCRRVNMYRGIISFSPETAAELGLTDRKAWEDYMERHILTLAKYNGIRVQNLQWVAAEFLPDHAAYHVDVLSGTFQIQVFINRPPYLLREVRPISGRQLIERPNGVRGQMDGFALGSDRGFFQVKPPFHKV